MKHSVFISYSQADRQTAEALAQRLADLGISHFLAHKEIAWGAKITDVIKQAMRSASHIVLILSPSSIESKWLTFEAGYAWAMKVPILPLLTHRQVELPEFLRAVRVAHNVAEIEEYFRLMLRQESTQGENNRKLSKSMEDDEEAKRKSYEATEQPTMANPQHVEIVKKGAESIAAWREKNPNKELNLFHADLNEANLAFADLSDANLNNANLLRANLRGADLHKADLCSVKLKDANLSGANLSGADLAAATLYRANLNRANLNRANMRGANLTEANLKGADLTGADLTGAILGSTSFGNTNLAEAKGLKDVEHRAPSTIGVDTLLKSQGKIPNVFLQGCGVPEAMITQLPAIRASIPPIQFYSCFISYSSDDDAFARRLYARLTAEKLRVWFAPQDMESGKKVADQIDTAIRVYDRTLLVLNEASMKSEGMRWEVKRAREKEQRSGRDVLVPIALVPYDKIKAWQCLDVDSGEDLAEKVREYHIPDFSEWTQEDAFEKAFGELMRDLRAEAGNGDDEGEG